MELFPNPDFWNALDELAGQSEIIVDRPKGSAHPNYPDFIYPMDYGYLSGTASMDGEGIDVWVGTAPSRRVNAVLCVVDKRKKDSEIKLLIGCTEEETALAYQTQNRTDFMKSILIRRDSGI